LQAEIEALKAASDARINAEVTDRSAANSEISQLKD